jgi:RNA polymerase sigma factor (sigma-70 family)
MLDTKALHAQILGLMPDIRRTVAKVLRNSRYYTDDHVEECVADIMAQIFDYGVRTFDASKGSAKSHFTCFAYSRALNWLHVAHRRFECVPDVTTSDEGEVTSISANVPATDNPEMLLVRAQEAARIRAAFTSLEPRQRALLAAFERLQSWSKAAEEIGVSAATASRMKAAIASQLR